MDSSLHLDFRHEGVTDLQLRVAITREQELADQAGAGNQGTRESGYYLADGVLCTSGKARVAIRPRGYKKAKAARVNRSIHNRQ